MADEVKEEVINEEIATNPSENNGKMSSKSSDISIEEIGPEDEEKVEKEDDAENLMPEVEEIEPTREILQKTAPEKSPSEDEEEDEDDEDDFEDETILERIAGLSEMFPKGLTNLISASASNFVSGAHWAYGASRTLTWVVCSSASIMFLPIMIETERSGLEEVQKQQQRQILLGPGSAMSGGNAQTNAPLPQSM